MRTNALMDEQLKKVLITVQSRAHTDLVKKSAAQGHVLCGIRGKYGCCLVRAINSQVSSAEFHYSIWDRNRGNVESRKTSRFAKNKGLYLTLFINSFLQIKPAQSHSLGRLFTVYFGAKIEFCPLFLFKKMVCDPIKPRRRLFQARWGLS